MVGAAAGVLFRPSPELRPGCDQYLVRLPVSGEILVESAHGRVEIAHQVVVAAELGVVRVESPERHVQQLHAGARNDQLGGQLERCRQLVLGRIDQLDVVRVVSHRLIAGRGRAQGRDGFRGRGDGGVEKRTVDARSPLVQGTDRGLDLAAARETESLLVLDHGHGRLKIAQRARDVGRAARASGQGVAVGVIGLRERPAEPSVHLSPRRVARLPDADRLEVGEGWIRIADALHDRDLAFVPQRLDARQVVVEPIALVEWQRLRDHRARKLGAQVVKHWVGKRHESAQAVVSTGELDHHQHVVVGDALLLGGVDGAGESVGHRGIAGGETCGAGAEHETRAQEVAALELVDADLVCHLVHTYFS